MSMPAVPILAVMNEKGGVGKSIIAQLLSEYGPIVEAKRVGGGDLDIQCNYTDATVGMEADPNVEGGQLPPKHPDFEPSDTLNERSSIADCYYGKLFLPYPTWVNQELTKNEGYLEVFCGHPERLEAINTIFAQAADQKYHQAKSTGVSLDEQAKKRLSEVHNRLADVLSAADFAEYYDLIILDTGPSRSPLFRSALRAATHLIVPFTPEEKDIQGINAMLQIVMQEQYSRTSDMPPLKLIGLAPNKVRSTRLHRQNLAAFKEVNGHMLLPEDCWLSLLTAFPERDMVGSIPKSIYHLPSKHPAKIQASAFGKHIYSSIFGDNQ